MLAIAQKSLGRFPLATTTSTCLVTARPHYFSLNSTILPDIHSMSEKTDPSKFLGSIIGSSVVVKLHNGLQYLGNLQSIDGYMNVALDGAKEIVGDKEGKSFNDVFIRGNNGMFHLSFEYSFWFGTLLTTVLYISEF